MYPILFIHSSVDRSLGCFPLLAVMNNAAKNSFVQVSVWIYVTSFGYIARSGIAESYSNSVFNLLRNSQTGSVAAAPFYILTRSV